jgi:hypothetical protein
VVFGQPVQPQPPCRIGTSDEARFFLTRSQARSRGTNAPQAQGGRVDLGLIRQRDARSRYGN